MYLNDVKDKLGLKIADGASHPMASYRRKSIWWRAVAFWKYRAGIWKNEGEHIEEWTEFPIETVRR